MELGYPEDDDVQIHGGGSSPHDGVQTVQPTELPINEGKGKARKFEPVESIIVLDEAPHMPSTPKGKRSTSQPTRKPAVRISFNRATASDADDDDERPSTPSRPCTPPNKPFSITFNTSLMRTPIAAKTPTRNNARFKVAADDSSAAEAAEEDKKKFGETESIFRTPLRKTGTQFFSPAPWTASPFRTPSRRHTLDPADPRLLLDDELNALASAAQSRGLQDSPVGFFGHGRGLLYESPSLPSPSQHWRPW